MTTGKVMAEKVHVNNTKKKKYHGRTTRERGKYS